MRSKHRVQYDPFLGIFLSVDPVTANSNTGANFNRYWYANNNSYKFIDPDGRDIVIGGVSDYQKKVKADVAAAKNADPDLK